MVDISPFCGVHYNQVLVNDLMSVICPPYDIITPQMQQELYQRSEFNFVRLEFNRVLPQDTDADNKYTRSSATLEQWLKQGILELDKAPAIYLHDHYFTYQGNEYRRRGITVAVRLEEWSKQAVRPHEGTMSEPKDDRLKLLWALQSNTSPIMALYEDNTGDVASLLAEQAKGQPIFRAGSVNGERHVIWAITEAEVVAQICSRLVDQPVYIADGHHRYESALTYMRERRACSPSVSGDEPFNFVMMTLVDFADRGLVVLPAHRLVRGVSKLKLGVLMSQLETFFTIAELPLSMPDVWQQVDNLMTENTDKVKLVLFGPVEEHLLVLTLRDVTTAGKMMPCFHSELYKKLSVSIVDHIIVEKLLGADGNNDEAFLSYSYDRIDAVNKVLDQEYQLACLLEPIRPEVIKAIADTGDRMPKKSTYFYPKLPVGLISRRLM